MTAGNQPNLAQINAKVGALAVQLRDLFQQIDYCDQELGSIQASGLVTMGATQTDADTIVSTMGNLETLSQIYQGKAVSQTLPFSFRDNSQGLWGFDVSNIAYLTINSSFGNVGENPPNAIIEADMVVKNPQNMVIHSQSGGASATLSYGDTHQTMLDNLATSARQTMNDPTLQVVFL